MKTAIYAASHALAAVGVAMLALSSPADAARESCGGHRLEPSPGYAATISTCQYGNGPQTWTDLMLTPGLQSAR